MKTARRIIAEELCDFMERTDIERMARSLTWHQIKELEAETQIREFGKWCCTTGIHLGYKAQIKFRGSRPESTEWDAIREISDEEAMRIHAAVVMLSEQEREVVYRVYQYCQPILAIMRDLRIGSTHTVDGVKLGALQKIIDFLKKTR